MTTYFDEAADWFQEQIERLARTGEDVAYIDGLNVDLEEKEAALVRDVTIAAEWPGCPPKVRDAIHRAVLEYAPNHQPRGVQGPAYATLSDIATGLLHMTHRLHDIFHVLGTAGLDDFNDDPRTPVNIMVGGGAERRDALQNGAAFDAESEIHGTQWMERKVNEAFSETRAALEEAARLRAKLAIVGTRVENVWRWVGDGSDHPESLSCHVIMSADTLRELIRTRGIVPNALAEAISIFETHAIPLSELDGIASRSENAHSEKARDTTLRLIESARDVHALLTFVRKAAERDEASRAEIARLQEFARGFNADVGVVCGVCKLPELVCACSPAVVKLPHVVRVGFDVGGVLSKYPEILRPIVAALAASADVEVHVLSDMHPHAKIVDWVVTRNGFAFTPEHIHSCDYDAHGEQCKAVKASELGIHVLFDDFMGYLSTVGAPTLRLLAMPDPTQDYYHPTWQTDGSEGNFGRRRKVTP